MTICGAVFFFLIAPLFVIFPLSFNAEEFLSFSDGMKSLDPDAFSLRWYKDMIYGTKNPWGLAAKNSFIIAIFATIGSVLLGTVAALGLSSRHMPYKGIVMAVLISPLMSFMKSLLIHLLQNLLERTTHLLVRFQIFLVGSAK